VDDVRWVECQVRIGRRFRQAPFWSAKLERRLLAQSLRDGILALSPERCLSTSWLWTHIPQDISLPVKTGDKHRPPVLVAGWLVIRDNGRLIPSRGHISERFAEAALTKLVGAAEKLNRIVDAERS